MIIKRNLKTQMPSLKRCKLGESTGDDDEKSSRKKRKTNGYYPLNLLDQLAAGIIPMSFNKLLGSAGVDKGFSASWCTEVTYSPEVEFKSKDRESTRDKINGKVEAQRPPLVRTSRGRVQVLPSRFNDSVIENWKKESKTSLPEYGSDYEIEIENKKEKFSFRTPKMCSQNSKKMNIEDRSRYKSRKYTALCEEEEGEEKGCVGGYKSLNGRKFYNSRNLGYEKLTEDDRRLCEVTEEQVDLEDDGRFSKANHARKDGLYGPEDFYSGDIVWAKPARKEPFWPAIVIDPFSQAPEPVLRACIADAACVMFFGYSGTKDHRDYAWVKRGMIFPLMDHVDRFQEQSELNDYKPNDFQMAIEEAFLAERGFTEKLTKDIKLAAGNSAFDESIIRGIRDTTGLYHGTEDHFLNKDAIGKNKDARSCEGCGLSLPFKLTKKMKISTQGGQLLCKTCARVRCDGCKVWVHAECDKISSNLFKNLGATDYYCPACKAKFNFELSDSEKGQPKVKWSKNDGQPNKVTVLCK